MVMESTGYRLDGQFGGAINLASELAMQYEISAIEPLLESCRAVATQEEISIAVLGRFKAGKSSFLNDLLSDSERAEVASFIGKQLKKAFDSAPPVYPYSVRPGYEHFRASLESTLVAGMLAEFQKQRGAILVRKLRTTLRECEEYLTLALTSAQMIRSERNALKAQVIGDKDFLDDVKSEIHLVIRHAMGSTRTRVAKSLEAHQATLQIQLTEALDGEFPNWTLNLDHALKSFEAWVGHSLSEELAAISAKHRAEFLAPLDRIKKQVLRALQGFRDQLSERALRAFGVPLRRTEVEIEIKEPSNPDIRVGHVFDRNWELLSPVAPMSLVKGVVLRHFKRRVPDMVEINLSRVASQWEQSINSALSEVDKEAQRRLDELVHTVERLLASSSDRVPQIQEDLRRIIAIRDETSGVAASLKIE